MLTERSYKEGWEWGMRYALHTERGFMCKTAFDYELGAACGGNRIHPSEEDLRRCSPCVDSCGIVEVEVRLVRVVQHDRIDEDGETADAG